MKAHDKHHLKEIIDERYYQSIMDETYTIDVGDIDVSDINDFSYLFYSLENLVRIDGIDNWDVEFDEENYNEVLLEDINGLNNWDVSNAVNMRCMFAGCSKLKELDLSGWDVSNVENTEFMFSSCHNLERIKGLEDWNVSNVKLATKMFHQSPNLDFGEPSQIDDWDLTNADTINMFINNEKAIQKYGESGIYFDYNQKYENVDVETLHNLKVLENFYRYQNGIKGIYDDSGIISRDIVGIMEQCVQDNVDFTISNPINENTIKYFDLDINNMKEQQDSINQALNFDIFKDIDKDLLDQNIKQMFSINNLKEKKMSNDKELNYQDNEEFMKHYNNVLAQNKSNMIDKYEEMYYILLLEPEAIQKACMVQVGTKEGWEEEIMEFEKGNISWEDLLNSAEFWGDENYYGDITNITGRDFNLLIKDIKEIYEDNKWCLENPEELYNDWQINQKELEKQVSKKMKM